MKTFIFGAGASVHAGYPLASALWDAMERWVRANFSEPSYLRSAVDTMNAEFDVSKSFELTLTDLDNRIEQLSRSESLAPDSIREKVLLVYLRDAVKSMIRLYFDAVRSQSADIYRTFASHVLMPGDAIITFNYDLALDRELKRSGKWNIGDGYGFTINGSSFGNSPCKLLKLHGSTNWRGELFKDLSGFFQGGWNDMSLGQRPSIDRSEFEYLGYTSFSDPECHDARTRVESMIMPTANKRFYIETSLGREWEGFWDSLWLQASAALEQSEEVHIIGYSAPKYDTRARDLLAASIHERARIRVCCRSGTSGVIASLKELLHLRNVVIQPACSTTFDDWVLCMNPA